MQRFIVAAVLISGILLAVNSCKDMGSEVPRTQSPSPQPVTLTQDSLILIPGTTAAARISGGTSPYVIVSQSDTTVAVASIVGDSLKVLARALGSSTIIIEDSGTPRSSATVTVSVTVPVSFSSQVQRIFTNNCVNGCHPGSGAPFPLLASVSYNNLVGVTATTGSCVGSKRVEPGSADASVLMKRLEGASCGSRMPYGLTPLSSADIQLIRDWINQGASNN